MRTNILASTIFTRILSDITERVDPPILPIDCRSPLIDLDGIDTPPTHARQRGMEPTNTREQVAVSERTSAHTG